MGLRRYIYIIVCLFLITPTFGQGDIKSESELKEKARSLFDQNKFLEAEPLYAQLLALYPKDVNYNFRYGACLLSSDSDKEKPIKYLKFAVSKATVDPLAYYYLGKTFHLNYEFAKAVKQFSKFKNKASSSQKEKYDVDRQIEMCKNGNNLLSKINEVQVLDKQVISVKDFFRIYDLKGIDGQIIIKPSDFMSKYDKKVDDKSILYLPNGTNEVYYSSYGNKGENGKDIFKSIKLGNGNWSDPVSLGESINTPYDEDFAFIHPDGRTLYFASKGHSSMGGYDLFMSTFDNTTNNWREPINLDFAFSSADDDVMFITDENKEFAFFASNRTNADGKYTVYKVKVEREAADISVIEGSFIAENNPTLKKAKITVIDKETNKTIGVYETDANGKYLVEIGKNGGSYQFNIETTENAPIHTGVVNVPKQSEFEVLGQELRLVGEGDDQTLVIKNIFDGTASSSRNNSGPQISSELIRKKASLDVNLSADEILALEINTKEITKSNEVAPENIITTNVETTEETSSNLYSKSEMVTELDQLYDQLNQQKRDLERSANHSFQNGIDLNIEAEKLFADAEQQENSNSSDGSISKLKQSAKETALKAAYSAQFGNEIEKNIEKLVELKESLTVVKSLIETDELSTADTEFQISKNKLESQLNSNDILVNNKKSAQELIEINQAKQVSFKKKISGFIDDRNLLNKKIKTLENDLNSGGEDSETLTSQIDGYKLDRSDMDYQLSTLESQLKNAENEEKSLAIKINQLSVLEKSFADLPSENEIGLDNKAKLDLLDAVKSYRDQDKLAFNSNPFSENNSFNDLVSNQKYNNSEVIPDTKNSPELGKSVSDIDFYYNEQLELSNSIVNELDKSAKKESLFSSWKAELENKLGEKEVLLSNTSDETKRNEIQIEVDDILVKINSIDKKSNELIASSSSELTSIEKSPVYGQSVEEIDNFYENAIKESNSIVNVTNRKSQKENLYSSWKADLENKLGEKEALLTNTVEESQRNNIQEELDGLLLKISSIEDKKVEDFASNSKGVTNNSGVSSNKGNVEVASNIENIDVTNVDQHSIISEDYTSFDLKQEYNYGNQNVNIDITEAKRSFAEAATFGKKSQDVRTSAYNLPTIEARNAAFEKAADYEKASKLKQIEAAEKYAIVNAAEFDRNNSLINNSDNYGQDFQSSNLDIANLLRDEAELYFNNALEIRAEISPDDRLTQKESNLQKAYDFEMLALSKQDEALKILKVVESEYETNPVTNIYDLAVKEVPTVKESIVIDDAEVMAVSSIDAAKSKGDSLNTLVESLSVQKKQIEAQILDTKKEDKKVALEAQIDDINLLQEKASNKADLYYLRAKQLEQEASEKESIREEVLASVNKIATVKEIRIIELDTVEISDERKELVQNSSAYILYLNNANKRERAVKSAELEYKKAIELAEKKQQLIKEAAFSKAVANQTSDQVEKERLIKSADVINQQLFKNQISLDSINNIIKVKNFLIKSSDRAMETSISSLSEIEKKEIIKMAIPNVNGEPLPSELLADLPVPNSSNEEINKNPIFSETSESINQLNSISSDNSQPEIESNEDEPITRKKEVNSNEDKSIQENTKTAVKPLERIERKSSVELATINQIPKQVKQAIFIKLKSNESAYDAAKPIPVDPKMPEGLVYKVQIGAFRNPIPQDLFKGFAPLMAEKVPSGITRYTAGLFVKEQEALLARNEIRTIGYPDAFVVAFLNGKRIGITESRKADNSAKNVSDVSVIKSGVNNNSSSVPKTSTGSKSNLPSSFNSLNVAEVVNVETIEGVFYTVQIGVYSKPLPIGEFDEYQPLNVKVLPSGLTRYNSGIFKNAIDANDLKEKVSLKIKDAFVTAYFNGKRISLGEAARINNRK
jgi:hypothetical protein